MNIKMLGLSLAFLATLGLATVAMAGSVTAQVTHKVMRSDGTKATSDEKHEFTGGSHLFFESLGDKEYAEKVGLTGDYTPVQEGWARLYLDWPNRVNSITIRKAGVKGSFKGGSIAVEVQNVKGKWTTVFERNDSDISSPVTISKELGRVGPIKGVRVNFKSPLPFTIGPIDLNG